MKRFPIFAVLAMSAVVAAIVAALANIHSAESQTRRAAPQSVPVTASSAATEIQVYVLARGGKFIGDDIGGAEVTLRDARTGEFLASGLTRGSSGAEDLMTVERARTEPISTTGAAVFTTTLMLDAPRLVAFEAYGPLAAQGSANRVTVTEWVLPQAFAENKIVLEIPGLTVAVLNPPTHFLPTTKPPIQLPLRVNVTMMCGCPIGPETDWKPQNYTVKALVTKPDATQDMVDLQFDENAPAQAPSQFIGTYTATQSGVYEMIVVARQVGEDNAGSDRVTFIIP
jgi:hypothetical protein